MDCQVFDFRKAALVDEPIARFFRAWMSKSCRIFQQRWPEICNSQIAVTPQPLYAQSFGNLLENCGQTAFGSVVRLELNDLPSFLTVQQTDLLALVLEVLAEDLNDKPAFRSLTSIELNLCQLLLEQLCAAFSEGWPQKEPLKCQTGPIDLMPHRSRLFAGDEPVVVATVEIQAKAGSLPFVWGFPRAALAKALQPIVGDWGPESPRSEPRLLVEEIPIEVTVQLGETQLGMQELLGLQPGTIIVLDQRIDSPLTAWLDGQPLFHGWPGRVGSKQAFQISEVP